MFFSIQFHIQLRFKSTWTSSSFLKRTSHCENSTFGWNNQINSIFGKCCMGTEVWPGVLNSRAQFNQICNAQTVVFMTWFHSSCVCLDIFHRSEQLSYLWLLQEHHRSPIGLTIIGEMWFCHRWQNGPLLPFLDLCSISNFLCQKTLTPIFNLMISSLKI